MAKHHDYTIMDIIFSDVLSFLELIMKNCRLLGIDMYDIDDNTYEVMVQLTFDIEGIGINYEDMIL